MKDIRVFLSLVVALALSACATTSRPSMSYVAPTVTASDAQTLADDAVQHLADPLPPARTTLVLDTPRGANDALTASMLEKLRARGFGVTQADPQTGPKADQGTPLRYLASPLENGVVLRLQYLGREATKFYPRTADGRLLNTAPFTVREGGSTNGQ